jgi:hypothetical protein
MRFFILIMALMSLASTSFAQDKDETKLPPFEMLPKVGQSPKTIYQLESLTEYWVYDSTGTEVMTGVAEFIDMSALKKGDYFIKYYDKTEQFRKERDPIVNKPGTTPPPNIKE